MGLRLQPAQACSSSDCRGGFRLAPTPNPAEMAKPSSFNRAPGKLHNIQQQTGPRKAQELTLSIPT